MTAPYARDSAFQFLRLVVKRAFAGWFKRIEGWGSSLTLLIGIALLTVHPSTAFQKTATAIPTWFCLAAFTCIVSFRLIASPYWIYRDQRREIAVLEAARKPALELSLPDPPVIDGIGLNGTTSESISGRRQTVMTRWASDVVALVCANRGENKAVACRARLMAVTRMGADGSSTLRVRPSLDLPWRKEQPEEALVFDIAASDEAWIWIAQVRTHGDIWLFRDIKRLPLEYQQLLGSSGTYQLLIQIDGENVAPQQIILEITSAEGAKPESGLWRGRADARIVNASAPRIA